MDVNNFSNLPLSFSQKKLEKDFPVKSRWMLDKQKQTQLCEETFALNVTRTHHNVSNEIMRSFSRFPNNDSVVFVKISLFAHQSFKGISMEKLISIEKSFNLFRSWFFFVIALEVSSLLLLL